MYFHDNMQEPLNQEVLSDKSKSGEERPWKVNKISSIDYSKSLSRQNSKKFFTVSQCGNYLEFKVFKNHNSKKLTKANFCKARLCPMCSWRRSLKIFGQVSKVMNLAVQENDYKFIFLTLTCKNVYGEDLSLAIDKLFHSFNKLTERKIFKKAVKGWFRALEVTHDTDEFITKDMWYGNKEKHIKSRSKYYISLGLRIGDKNPNFDTYHPHFHIVLAVNKSYFTDKNYYISQEKWTEVWKECLDVDYPPRVDVRVFKADNNTQLLKSVAESTKYSVKSNDFIIKNHKGEIDEKMTDKAIAILDNALHNRRLVAYGGELRKIHKKLNLDDPEKGDLINTGNEEELREDLDFFIERYFWSIGYSNYFKF